jgi:ubiquinone/menaquinone biosynthesis C-methylase UbiE
MEDKIVKLQELVDAILIKRSANPRILEAGCGSRMQIHFSERAHITGIDISEKQLLRNMDVDERIVGDIQSYDYRPSSFDIIICWNVLEHLQNPLSALHRFVEAIKPDGIIILGLPNVLSMKGLLTKYTPHVFHVWAYKHLFGITDAGKDDNAPFRTFLSYTVSPIAIKRFALQAGLEILYFASYDTEFYRQKLGLFFSIPNWIIKRLSFGRLGETDFVMALKKSDSKCEENTTYARTQEATLKTQDQFSRLLP